MCSLEPKGFPLLLPTNITIIYECKVSPRHVALASLHPNIIKEVKSLYESEERCILSTRILPIELCVEGSVWYELFT